MSSPPPAPSPSAIAPGSPPFSPFNARTSQSPSFRTEMQSPTTHHAGQGSSQSQPIQVAGDDDDEHSLPGTPPPEPVNPWTEDEGMQLVAFLSTSRGPLTIADVAKHTGRPMAHAAAMVVSIWHAALAVAQQRGSRVSWWVGRPLSNNIGLRRSVVLTVDRGTVVLVFYGTDDAEGTRMPIDGPRQMYEATQIQG